MREIKSRVFAKDEQFPEGKIHSPNTLTEIDKVMARMKTTDVSLMQYKVYLLIRGKKFMKETL
jgi:hypothetical protein